MATEIRGNRNGGLTSTVTLLVLVALAYLPFLWRYRERTGPLFILAGAIYGGGAVGVEHFTLSSDAGDPLFPNSVECMRLIRGYMEAFGLNQDELYQTCTVNPAKVVGLN